MKTWCHAFAITFLLLLLTPSLFSPRSLARDSASSIHKQTTTLDQILSVINGQPITLWHLHFLRAYLLATQGAGLGWPITIEHPENLEEGVLLDFAITDELLFGGATRLTSIQIAEKEIIAQIRAFRSMFSSDQDFQAFASRYEFRDDEAREFFIRRLRIKAYIDLNVDPSRGKTSEPFSTGTRVAEQFNQLTLELRERAIIHVPSKAPGR